MFKAYSGGLLIAAFLLVTPAHAANSCAELFGAAPSQAEILEQVIRETPALAHLTTVESLIGMLKDGAIRPLNELTSTGERVGGAHGPGDSVFMKPRFNNKDLRSGGTLMGPTLLISTSVLRRRDYYYNIHGWSADGYFKPYSSDRLSFRSTEWQLEHPQITGEIAFAHAVSLKDYAMGIWIPSDQYQAFKTAAAKAGIDLNSLPFPITVADYLPSPEEMLELSRHKPGPHSLPAEHRLDHPTVQRSLYMRYREPNKFLSSIDDPNVPADERAQLLEFLEMGYLGKEIDTDYRNVLWRLRILEAHESGSYVLKFIGAATAHPDAEAHRGELETFLKDYFSKKPTDQKSIVRMGERTDYLFTINHVYDFIPTDVVWNSPRIRTEDGKLPYKRFTGQGAPAIFRTQ